MRSLLSASVLSLAALAVGSLSLAPAQAQTVQISGAGATFPAPLLQRWFDTYNRTVDSNVQVSYQSVGSGAGLEQVINGTVDFGVSEAPFSGARLESFRSKFGYEPLQLPMGGGAIEFAYNIPGIESQELILKRETYCGIVTGEITNWNDIRIKAQNPTLVDRLPDLPITWVHRSDGSGTTFVFTNHLKTVCPNWTAGAGTSVEWPVGIGGQGNEGVAAAILQEEGAIGYVNQSYAKLENMDTARIENKSGNVVAFSPEAATSALDAPIPDDFALLVPDPEGPQDYPIVGLFWVMFYREYPDATKLEKLREVFKWTQGPDGQALTRELDYIPMPDSAIERIFAELDAITVNPNAVR
ncbi:phosphate ABC transporter substrate-binding protein PstS [Thermostichus vulcanus]|uniref:Phosphate-binding protein n=1 Tax=Thermostichus vulcanus str. 'Rupite' TaxID=2813851 RepID=A0ABT0CA00_THEVL|nr:phosphate ABC transporter substrate-binding protein PstS [Thermostichus vulcanus]MCJ2542603.1 phosphate ABC transporter substrate-binding protein PstS [Thermostichus vulcanus str. 'Rupite']